MFWFKQLTCQLGELALWPNLRLQPGETSKKLSSLGEALDAMVMILAHRTECPIFYITNKTLASAIKKPSYRTQDKIYAFLSCT